jgi:hypothetical protein
MEDVTSRSRSGDGDAARPPATKTSERVRNRDEFVATVILAIASVLTAWSAFQATKWSGLQSIAFSESAAARAAWNRATTQAATAREIDISLFLAWLQALARERAEGRSAAAPGQPYRPQPGTVSGFLFERLRKEFKPAMEAWLATRPIANPDAPPSPFAMREYSLAAEEEAKTFSDRAEERAADARRYNTQSDAYVGTTVFLSLVLFFSGIASKLEGRLARWVMISGAGVFLVIAASMLASFPVALG